MIPLNDFSRQWRDVSEEALAAFAATGESGWYILGREVREFEDELAAFWHTGYAVGVASGLDALEIGLRCLGCKPGDKVLTTPVSAFATTLAVLRIGAVPVFVDTDECGLIDLSGVRHVLSRDESIRFFLPVHLFGHALNACGIRSL
ncbi:MAG: DegT/DnrJ/EryC1/StrS aminotransferase family protein, partial [Acidobacteriaceae bacterium]|nr:DegT/DnrJ/EryC1/StrS aminotransferase family protein [Acidobacteriaceae bacterium]